MRIFPFIGGTLEQRRVGIWPWFWFDIAFGRAVYPSAGLQFTPCGNTAPQRIKTAAEVRNVSVSLVSKLSDGESLVGIPTLSSTPSGLKLYLPVVNMLRMTIDNAIVDPGQAIQFAVSGGESGTTYILDVQCETSAGETLEVYCPLLVQNS